MLVLGRKFGQSIILRDGNKIIAVLTILKASGHSKQVRVGIEADSNINIERFEIATEEIKEQAKPYTFEGRLQSRIKSASK